MKMSDKKIENPPAFPVTGELGVYQTGLSLRDYFAAKAMQTLVTRLSSPTGYMNTDEEGMARDAYKLADTMLKERSKEL